MIKINLIILFILLSKVSFGQEIKLMDYMQYPRLDSAYWQKDYEFLNSKSSRIANKCQTCVFQQSDSTRGRFCFNTSLGHIQLDTALHNFSIEKLVGKWELVNFGEFEVIDSTVTGSKNYFRKAKILNEKTDNIGFIVFTDKRMKVNFIDNKEFPNRNKNYKILDGKYLTIKSIGGYCGATIIGMTKDGFLLLDDHTLRTNAKMGEYLTVRTSVRRMILKKV